MIMRKQKALARPSSVQDVIACSSYKRPHVGHLAIHYKLRYVHGKRIWLCKTSEGDAERGGNSISVKQWLLV